ncbi:LamG domain-containing protein [Planctomycetota bacterium]
MCKKLFFIVSTLLLLLSLGQLARGDLIAYYPLDGDALDASGNGWDGEESGGPLTYEAGMIGDALSLNNTSGQGIITGATASMLGIGGADPRTIACWVYTNAPMATGRAIWEMGNSAGGQHWSIRTITAPEGWRVQIWAPDYDYSVPSENVWVHHALSYDGSQISVFVNGVLIHSYAASLNTADNRPFHIGLYGGNEATAVSFDGLIDDVQIYNHALTEEEVLSAMAGLSKGLASKPNPEDEEIEVSIDTDISWEPGEYARRHNVFFSTVFDDANDADLTNQLDALLVENYDSNMYDLDRLDYGQSYYWRVDEVNGAPDFTVYKGNTWGFTTEHLAYPIDGDNILATSSTAAAGKGPENTINRSGLEPSSELPLLCTGEHSSEGADMWLTESNDPAPSIQYEFNTVYNLHEMLVWNYNAETINSLNGASSVLIEHSVDGDSWTANDTTSLDQASGTNDYQAGAVSFGDAPAKYVRITINSNFGGELGLGAVFNQYGLSEVMFMVIPVQAKDPVPANGAVDIALDGVTLGWTAGRGAVEHDVYFDGNLMEAGLTQTSYDISMPLDLSTTYDWRIDEVNNANSYPVWAGGAWSFTTIDYLGVEDFEDYNNTTGYRIYDNAWVDGYDNPANGAFIGHDPDFVANPNADIVETGITYNDTDQSAPIYYDNTAAFSSEVSIDPALLAIGSDWSRGSPTALVIYVYGDAANLASERLYASVNNSKTYFDGDLTVEAWSAFVVDLTGVNLGGVTKLAIGVERGGAAGGAGIFYVDEIRLYGSAPVAE